MSKRKPVNPMSDLEGMARPQPKQNEPKQSKDFDSESSESQPDEQKKIGNTYYLTPDTHWRLDAAKAQLRRATGKMISKSDIVEMAVTAALDEFEQRGENSYLAILLSKD